VIKQLKKASWDHMFGEHLQNMCFTSQGLITMVEVKDVAEFELRVYGPA
jgi:hypothetical protein